MKDQEGEEIKLHDKVVVLYNIIFSTDKQIGIGYVIDINKDVATIQLKNGRIVQKTSDEFFKQCTAKQ